MCGIPYVFDQPMIFATFLHKVDKKGNPKCGWGCNAVPYKMLGLHVGAPQAPIQLGGWQHTIRKGLTRMHISFTIWYYILLISFILYSIDIYCDHTTIHQLTKIIINHHWHQHPLNSDHCQHRHRGLSSTSPLALSCWSSSSSSSSPSSSSSSSTQFPCSYQLQHMLSSSIHNPSI